MIDWNENQVILNDSLISTMRLYFETSFYSMGRIDANSPKRGVTEYKFLKVFTVNIDWITG